MSSVSIWASFGVCDPALSGFDPLAGVGKQASVTRMLPKRCGTAIRVGLWVFSLVGFWGRPRSWVCRIDGFIEVHGLRGWRGLSSLSSRDVGVPTPSTVVAVFLRLGNCGAGGWIISVIKLAHSQKVLLFTRSPGAWLTYEVR